MKIFEQARSLINAALIESLFTVPGAYWGNGEFWTLNPIRGDSNIGSFSITEDGLWHDFAGGDSGDLVDMFVEWKNISKVEAAKEIIRLRGRTPDEEPNHDKPYNEKITSKKKVKAAEKYKPLIPIYESIARTLNDYLKAEWIGEKYGKAVNAWPWRDAYGEILYITARHEKTDENGNIHKDVVPWFFGEDNKWHPGQPLDSGRPVFKLDELSKLPDDTIIDIVEGEKCSSVVVGLTLTTWTGGTNAVHKTDWSTIARFKNIRIWPDADNQFDKNGKLIPWVKQPGMKSALEIAKRLPQAVILDTSEFAKVKDGWDIADAVESGMNIGELLLSFKKINTEIKIDEPDNPGVPFICLGYDDSRHWFMRRDIRLIYSIEMGHFTTSKLGELAELSFWSIQGHVTDSNGIKLATAQDDLTSMSRSAGRYDPERVRGAGVWRDNGEYIINDGDCLIRYNGKKISFNEYKTKYFYISSSVKFPEMQGEISTIDEGRKLEELFRVQDFVNPAHHVLAMGWSLIANFGGLLKWRPHIWPTGKQGSGKTFILEKLISPILGSFAHIGSGKDSEPGIRRSLNLDARSVILDEMDPKNNKAREKVLAILELARNASSDGSGNITLAATDGSGVQKFKIRSCFCFGSVHMIEDDAAISSRISRLEMKVVKNMKDKISKSEPLREILMIDPQRYTRRIFKSIDRIILDIKYLRETMLKTFGEQRRVDQLAPMLAAAWAIQSDLSIEESQEGKDWLSKYIVDLSKPDTGAMDDEEEVINHILSAHIRINDTNDGVKTIAELMHTGYVLNNVDSSETLSKYGIKQLMKDGIKVLAIAKKSDQIKNLLRNTPYQFSYDSQLRRHRFCINDKPHQVRMAGMQVQAFLFDWYQFKDDYLSDDELKLEDKEIEF
jgi:putative DNA primase/helicase